LNRTSGIERSSKLWERAQAAIAGGTQVISKRPDRWLPGLYPIYAERGRGSHLWDVDGNEYIDYILALGPIVLGYCYEPVDAAVREQLGKGTIFGLNSPLEVELAEKIIEVVPCAEMVRFSKTGSDVTSMAIRIARAYSGREKVAFCGYHGWHDWYVAHSLPNEQGVADAPFMKVNMDGRGVPARLRELVIPFPYGDLAALETVLSQNSIACIIMEPAKRSVPPKGYLQGVRSLADHYGVVLIFDEIVTGFRLAMGGAQAYFGVTPDLATFGKGMANGYPLSAVVGRREIMELASSLFISTTYGGECLSLAAGLATINELQRIDAHTHMYAMGKRLQQGMNALAEEYGVSARMDSLPVMVYLDFDGDTPEQQKQMTQLFTQEMVLRGVLWGGSFVSYAHTEADIDLSLEAAREAFAMVRRALDAEDLRRYIRGKEPKPGFHRMV
jgi:glutamate-1-semialdehyde 2,1-aminomutase